jgi:uncharacterized protein DUF3313
MKRIQVVLLISFFALLEACASTYQAKPENPSTFLQDNAKFGIPVEAVVPHVHARSKVNWAAYNKIQVKPIVINDGFASQLSRDQEAEIRLLTKSFYDILVERLSKDYALVEEPTPGAMIVQIVITQAEPSWIGPQLLSKVSWQLQAVNSVVRYFRGKPAFAGEITIQFTVHDPMTGEMLFAGTDRRVGGQNLFDRELINSWGDVQNSLEFWTEQSAYHLCLARRGSNCAAPKA